ncbi:hypothetical protein [Alkalicoccobacillus plakortidis]|nr:hypothetical protein [Alkalicoccobacillus plakortidis]
MNETMIEVPFGSIFFQLIAFAVLCVIFYVVFKGIKALSKYNRN